MQTRLSQFISEYFHKTLNVSYVSDWVSNDLIGQYTFKIKLVNFGLVELTIMRDGHDNDESYDDEYLLKELSILSGHHLDLVKHLNSPYYYDLKQIGKWVA